MAPDPAAWTTPPRGFSVSRARDAVDRALRVARAAGIDAERGEVIAEGANILVRLEPGPVVARISHLIDILHADGSWPWFVREVGLTRYLAQRGVLAPRPVAGPFHDEGVSLSLWEWLEHDPYPRVSDHDLATSLAALHDVMAGYGGALPDVRDVVGELPALCERLRDEPDLRDAVPVFERATASVLGALDRRDPGRARVLHGDAHGGNVVAVGDELVWIDFEDCCRGPVEYDLGCLIAHARVAGDRNEQALLAAYGDDYDPELLELMVEVRSLQMTVWSAILGTEEPETPRWKARVERWLADHRD